MTIAHVLLVGADTPAIADVLSGFAEVARAVGAREVHYGSNLAPPIFAAGFPAGLTAVVDSEQALDAYLDHPRHHELVTRLEATGARVVVADISHAGPIDRTEQ